MYTTIPAHHSMPVSQTMSTAIAMIALTIGGTGSVFELSHANQWGKMLDTRVPYFDVRTENVDSVRPDIRSAAEHLANIREVLSPAIADLAAAFGVSRQAIYKWIGGESTPEADKMERIRSLSLAADAFQNAEVTRASSLLKMKAFDGRSLLDLVAAGQLAAKHTQALIAEAQAMNAAYDRSGLATSKAAPSEDWRTELSIPGSSE